MYPINISKTPFFAPSVSLSFAQSNSPSIASTDITHIPSKYPTDIQSISPTESIDMPVKNPVQFPTNIQSYIPTYSTKGQSIIRFKYHTKRPTKARGIWVDFECPMVNGITKKNQINIGNDKNNYYFQMEKTTNNYNDINSEYLLKINVNKWNNIEANCSVNYFVDIDDKTESGYNTRTLTKSNSNLIDITNHIDINIQQSIYNILCNNNSGVSDYTDNDNENKMDSNDTGNDTITPAVSPDIGMKMCDNKYISTLEPNVFDICLLTSSPLVVKGNNIQNEDSLEYLHNALPNRIDQYMCAVCFLKF